MLIKIINTSISLLENNVNKKAMGNKQAQFNNIQKRSAVSLAVVMALGAFNAQAEEETNATDNIEVIEVTGIRASMAENLAIKRLSSSIVDAITAEDIGKFPDKNIADSLQRVPGIVISRSGGEGSEVSVRGLPSSLTYTQLNGNYIASSAGDPQRSFDYALLPSTMIQRVEVHKSSQAKLDEGGVGGTVILHTRKPLDMEASSGVLSAEYTYADVTEDYEPSFSGVYSWKNENENFGFLVGYTKQDRTNRSLSGGTTNGGGLRWATGSDKPATDVNGQTIDDSFRRFGALTTSNGEVIDGAWVPQVVDVTVTKEDRQREGAQFTTQWAPVDNMVFTANYFHFGLSQDRTNSQIFVPEWRYNADHLTDVHLDPSGTVVTGLDFTSGASGIEQNLIFPWIVGNYVVQEDTSDSYDLGLDYQADNFDLRVKVGHTEADGGPSEAWNAAYYGGLNSGSEVENGASYAGWRIDDQVSIYMDPNFISNLQNGIGGNPDPGSTFSSYIVSDIEENYAQLDLDYDLDHDIFNTVSFGVKYRKSELHRETRNTFFITQEGLDQINDGTLDPLTGDIDGVSYQRIGGMPNFADIMNSKGEGNIVAGFDINAMPTINWNRYREQVTSNYNPYTRREPNFVFDIEEEITAAYIQTDFSYNSIRGNFGLRFVETETTVASTDQITYLIDRTDDETGEAVSGDARFIDVRETISRTQKESTILPSLNVIWDATDDVVVRFAASETMSRPELGDLGRPENLTFTSQEWVDDRESEGVPVPQGWKGSGGNKALKPFESTQLDLSVEYYYAEASAVGAAIFNKKVDNFVVPLIISSTRSFDGFGSLVPAGDITVAPFDTRANGTNATSKGIELFIQHAFDNGFGFNANYTYNDTNQADVSIDGEKLGESELIGSSKNQVNFSAYYENDTFSARASYNRRGEQSAGLFDGLTAYTDPYSQVDLNASYNLLENLVLTASVINLTESESTTRIGNDTKARLSRNSYTGRRYYVGMTYKF